MPERLSIPAIAGKCVVSESLQGSQLRQLLNMLVDVPTESTRPTACLVHAVKAVPKLSTRSTGSYSNRIESGMAVLLAASQAIGQLDVR
jgi:hypothetical protein